MESNLNHVEVFSRRAFEAIGGEGELGSTDICRAIGRQLSESDNESVLGSAFRKDVPVYIPAFTDSELGWTCRSGRCAGRSPRASPTRETCSARDLPSTRTWT